MSEDFARIFNLEDNDHIVTHRALAEIDDFVTEMGGNQLDQYGLPQPERDAAERAGVDYRRETSHNVDEEKEVAVKNTNRLNEEQLVVHDEFFVAAFNISGVLYFSDAPGGCGKTFLIQTILATMRSQSRIITTTASSGLAATPIPGLPSTALLRFLLISHNVHKIRARRFHQHAAQRTAGVLNIQFYMQQNQPLPKLSEVFYARQV